MMVSQLHKCDALHRVHRPPADFIFSGVMTEVLTIPQIPALIRPAEDVRIRVE